MIFLTRMWKVWVSPNICIRGNPPKGLGGFKGLT